MGHFSVSCFATGLDIPYGRVGLIPLRYSDYSDIGREQFIPPIPVSNDGAYIHYHPLCLPIWGEYDTYGRLESIEKDVNTAAIEKRFGIPIEKFVKDILESNFKLKITGEELVKKNGKKHAKDESVKSDSKWVPFEREELITACWVHADSYDDLCNFQTNFGDSDESVVSTLDNSSFVLKKLGFEYVREYDDGTIEDPDAPLKGMLSRMEKRNKSTDPKSRFRYLYVHPDCPEMEVWSDNTWVHFDNHQTPYHPDQLAKLAKEEYNFDLDLSPFTGMTKYHVAFDKAIAKSKESDMAGLLKERLIDEVDPQKRELLEDKIDDYNSRSFADAFRSLPLSSYISNFNPMTEIYYDVVFNGSKEEIWQFRDMLAKYMGFYWNCMYANRPFLPSVSGIQDGEHIAKVRMAAAVIKDALKRAKAWDEEEDDEPTQYAKNIEKALQKILPEIKVL